MTVKLMTELDLRGKRVLIREDLNVPIADGTVTSDARIRASLPTIRTAMEKGAKVFLMSHLGRPEEGVFAEEFSLAPVATRLSELLGKPVPLRENWLRDGVGTGFGEAVSRVVGGVLATYYLAFFLSVGGVKGVFTFMAVAFAIAIIALWIWGQETARRSVEDTSAAPQK